MTERALKLMPSGKLVDILRPRVEDVDVFDIAHCLARITRFNGAGDVPMSVAQHCVIVSRLVSVERAAWALLHDAAEAYLGDMSSGLKHSRIGQNFTELEDLWEWCIARRLYLCRHSVKYYDNVALLWEQRDNGPHGMTTDKFAKACGIACVPPLPNERLEVWDYKRAEEEWLARFCELGIVDTRARGGVAK